MRFRDYLRDALDHPDPLQAILGASSSDLVELAGQLKDAIDQALQDDPDRRIVSPLLEMYLKVQRQFDRFVQLDRRLSTIPPPAPPPSEESQL